MRMTFEGKFITAKCDGAITEAEQFPNDKPNVETTHYMNRTQKVIIGTNGVPLNCIRYDKGQCISHIATEVLPPEALILVGNGSNYHIEIVRKECKAALTLQKFLSDFSQNEEK